MTTKVSEQDYVKIAKETIRQHLEAGRDMEDYVVEQSKARKFNEKQARRLVERVNTMMHLNRADDLAQKKAEHRYVTFDTVDAEKVLSRLGSKTVEKEASYTPYTPGGYYTKAASVKTLEDTGYVEPDLPFTKNASIQEKTAHTTEAVASFADLLSNEEREKVASISQRQTEQVKIARHNANLRRMHKIANELNMRLAQEHEALKGAVRAFGFHMEKMSSEALRDLWEDFDAANPEFSKIARNLLKQHYRTHNYQVPAFDKTASIAMSTSGKAWDYIQEIGAQREKTLKTALALKKIQGSDVLSLSYR